MIAKKSPPHKRQAALCVLQFGRVPFRIDESNAREGRTVLNIREDKAAQRRRGIEARRSLGEAERAAANAALCRHLEALPAWQEARRVLAYAAFGGEADLSALLVQAARAGKTIAYPLCGEDCSMEAALPGGPEGWERGKYGIRTPVRETARILPPEELDLVLLPCTAFDAGCRRLGMGKGYYDRYLPRCTRAAAIGIAFEAQKTERVAVEPHDRRLDGFLTERGFYSWKK